MARIRIQSGDLRHRVTIASKGSGPAIPDPMGTGDDIAPETTLGPFPAKVVPLSGRELFNAARVEAITSHRIILRDVPGRVIRPGDEIGWNGATLGIESVIPVEARGFWLEIMAHQVERGPE